MSRTSRSPEIVAFRGALQSLRAVAEARFPRVTPAPPKPPREDEDDEGSSSGASFGFDGDTLTATGSHPRVSETRRS